VLDAAGGRAAVSRAAVAVVAELSSLDQSIAADRVGDGLGLAGCAAVGGVVGTGVADIAETVAVAIGLVAIGIVGAVVAGVADTVTVDVALVGVDLVGTVVNAVRDAVVVTVTRVFRSKACWTQTKAIAASGTIST
jgi:hypothetical protein